MLTLRVIVPDVIRLAHFTTLSIGREVFVLHKARLDVESDVLDHAATASIEK